MVCRSAMYGFICNIFMAYNRLKKINVFQTYEEV